MNLHDSVFPDELDLTIFFESEPIEKRSDETSLTYEYRDEGLVSLKVSFGIVRRAISVEVFYDDDAVVQFSTEGVEKIVLVENASRLIIAHVGVECVKGEVWIHLEPKIFFKSYLFDE